MLFIFDGGQPDERAPAPSDDEIEEIKFWADDELSAVLPTRLHTRVASALRADRDDTYLEHGTVVNSSRTAVRSS